MPGLIWVLAGCTCHIVGFVVMWLMLYWQEMANVQCLYLPTLQTKVPDLILSNLISGMRPYHKLKFYFHDKVVSGTLNPLPISSIMISLWYGSWVLSWACQRGKRPAEHGFLTCTIMILSFQTDRSRLRSVPTPLLLLDTLFHGKTTLYKV